MGKNVLKGRGGRLTHDEIEIVKIYLDETAKLRGKTEDWNVYPEGYFECSIGLHNLIIKLGGGCPLQAAQVRRKMEIGQDWKSDLPVFTKVELGLLPDPNLGTTSTG